MANYNVNINRTVSFSYLLKSDDRIINRTVSFGRLPALSNCDVCDSGQDSGEQCSDEQRVIWLYPAK
jgi:hypothetical protein